MCVLNGVYDHGDGICVMSAMCKEIDLQMIEEGVQRFFKNSILSRTGYKM